MKTNFLKLLPLAAIVIITFSCVRTCPPIRRPSDLQPIDRENYNSVRTVFWNYTRFCSDGFAGEGDSIKVVGYRPWFFTMFSLTDNPRFITEGDGASPTGGTIWIRYDKSNEELVRKIAIADFTKRIYIRGVIGFNCLHTKGGCSRMAVEVFISKPEDIRFGERVRN